ncbi:hypothetical protein ANO11243_065360 [Dothideomycetidae sp. 11243]|nr:hypothetical protein ANO11243_065360 [fungal sp. No.11243]
MAYHYSGYYGSPNQQQQPPPPPQQYQYPPQTGQEQYNTSTANGQSGVQQYQHALQGQPMYTNGHAYPPLQSPTSPPAQAATSASPAYPGQQYPQTNYQQHGSYNPQAYAQNSPQYHPQTYSGVSTHLTTMHPGYSSTAYGSQYTQNQAPSYPANYYRRQSYNPGDYSATTYSSSTGPPVSGHSPAQSPNRFDSSQYRTEGHFSPSLQYDTHSPVPPPVPPRPNSATPTTISTYASYTQPAAQMASSYTPSATQTPYPDYDSAATAMPGYDDRQPDFDLVNDITADELNLPLRPAPPAYSPSSVHYLKSDTPRRRRSTPASPNSQPPRGDEPSDVPPPPPAHGSQRNSPSVRHPQLRPLPGPPQPDVGAEHYRRPVTHVDTNDLEYSAEWQDELFDEVESAIMNAGSPAAFTSSPAMRHATTSSSNSPRPIFGSHRRKDDTLSNGYSSRSADRGNDSDAEALGGLEAMRMADEEEAAAEERRRASGTGGLLGATSTHDDDNDNYNTIDMGLYGGGYEGTMSYGGAPYTIPGSSRSQPPSPGSFQTRPQNHDRELSYDSTTEVLRPSHSFTVARVDSGGTGGLIDANQDPRPRSIDEGDAYSFTEDTVETSGPPDLFFMPDVSSLYRPLPPPPSSSSDSMSGIATPATSSASNSGYPLTPSASLRAAHQTQSDVAVPRFSSMREFSATPPIGHPTRSKTDAEDRLRKPVLRTSIEYRNSANITLPATPATNTVTIDLPSLPSKRFNISKLGASEFRRCEEPWALSSIYQWVRHIANPEQVTELKESMIREALVALFTNKVPTMNITDAEVLSLRVVREMYDAGVLRPMEEWVRLVPGPMSGVIFQLTQGGCYSPTLHDHEVPGRCYASHCQRTLKRVNLYATPSRSGEDWATYYKLSKEDVDGRDKKEIERQNILHEIVQTEDQYMEQINVLQHVYRDNLISAQPTIIDSRRLNVFLRDVFGKVDAVRKANEDHLLAQLKYRQNEQGPWIVGFSDIFRQWIRKARHAYIEYAAAFPAASLMVRQEQERNIDFMAFLEKARANKASNRLGLDTYLKAPITRLQRYSLLLMTVHKNMKDESDEKANLQVAIDEVKEATKECDARVAEMQRKVDLADLNQKLILRPGMSQDVELNLNHLGRRLIHQGTLQRTGSKKFNWVDCHALLFDHYFILAKAISVIQRGTGVKIEKYDVSRFPIPMDLLILEGFDEDPVRQSHYVRGLTTVATVPRTPGSDALRGRAGTISSPSPAFDPSAPPTTTITEAAKDSEKILYPFKIKHLGRETYTLFAHSAGQRTEWKVKMIEAKTKHAKSLYRQNAEPFHLNVIADSSFYYDSSSNIVSTKPVAIEDTPMERAIEKVELRFKDAGRPAPVCRARINCATSFTTPYPGKKMTAIGTDYGVFISEADHPRGWIRTITMPKVTQMAVLEEFSVFLILSSGSLIAYHLDIVTNPATANGAGDTSARRAPQKLSGSRDVGFFAVGKMKERTLVFYKKRDGLSSTFKVLEPVFQKSTEKKRGIFKRGNTEFFRDFDEFYIPTECGGMNLFTNSLCVSTSKGFEVLTLDKKQTFSVPDLRAPEVGNIAQHIDGQTTLGMLRLSDQEFILCYEKCAVYVNKHGDVSRSVIMNFVGKAKSAALHGAFLVLFDADFVEIRNAQNGRLKQIISGRDVRCLDDGGGGSLSGGSLQPVAAANGMANGSSNTAARTVKVAMAHPANERCQIVVELLLNQDLKE